MSETTRGRQPAEPAGWVDGASPARPARARRSPWSLLLLVPLLMLVTPWINTVEPQLFGMPFFYWVQFAWVPIGVICVAIVNATTPDTRWTGDSEGDR